MMTYWQIQELRVAIHDQASAFQKYVLANTDDLRATAIADYVNASSRASLAFESSGPANGGEQ